MLAHELKIFGSEDLYVNDYHLVVSYRKCDSGLFEISSNGKTYIVDTYASLQSNGGNSKSLTPAVTHYRPYY